MGDNCTGPLGQHLRTVSGKSEEQQPSRGQHDPATARAALGPLLHAVGERVQAGRRASIACGESRSPATHGRQWSRMAQDLAGSAISVREHHLGQVVGCAQRLRWY